MFRVGQKVVCVDDALIDARWPKNGEIFKDQIYTVRSLDITVLGHPGVRLEEVELTSEPGHCGKISRKVLRDSPYRIDRFRPIVERKTDISIFTKMLKTEYVS